uniref:Seven TM Receptor n=1 Tax=Caenorhabditis tropicalis TaxID=1561998 RepID=A0A1I7T5I7_9PELO
MHLHRSGWIIYADSCIKAYPKVSKFLVSLYCASFGLCVSLLASHFVYRFLAICRPSDLRLLDGWNLLKIYICPVIFFTIWFLIGWIPCAPSGLRSEYMRASLNETYNEDTYQLGYIGMLYYACLGCCGIMQTCILTMVICGWKTYKKMQSVGATMSLKTKELNNQLFKALTLQTLVPMLTMFTPVGLLLILPMFSVSVGTLSNAPSMNAAIYPALDAIIAIFMIRDFREAVVCKRGRKVTFSTTTSGAQYSVSNENWNS